MRTSDKLAALTLLVTAFFYGQTACAQGVAPMTYGPNGPNGMPMGNHSPVSWGALPSQGFEPWPTVSPFENKFSQHLNKNGLWFSDSRSATASNRSYVFGIEFLNTTTKEDKGLVGNANAQSYYEMVYDDLVTETDQQYADDFQFSNYYSAASTALAGQIEGSGMRVTAGWWNSDDTGVMFETIWNADSSSVFDARQATTTFAAFSPTTTGAAGSTASTFADRANQLDLVRQLLSAPDFLLSDIDPIDPDLLLQQNLLNLRGIPIDNGTFAGGSIAYDLNYRLEVSSQVLGGGLNYVMAPIIKSDGFMVRPVVGLRYINMQESFRFDGEDSGLLYDDSVAGTGDPTVDLKLQSIPDGVDNDDDGIIDNGGIAEDSTTFTATNFDAIATGGVDGVSSSIVNSHLYSDANSHLAGPEIGLRYDFGGDKKDSFKIWGQTKVGLLVNHEELEMTGDNIGLFTRFEAGTYDGTIGSAAPTETFAPTLADPNPNAFSASASTTHVSPLVEQSIFAELPVFEYVPVIGDAKIFEGAKLKLGYSITFIDQVASNTQSVVWQGNPVQGLFPVYDLERRSWWTSNWSAGLEWRY